MSNDQQSTAIVQQKETFAGIETQQVGETSGMVLAAAARAQIEAACIMAERHPRDILEFRAKMLNECKRPGFALVAKYRLPRTKWDPDKQERVDASIVGPSIRFAEACMRYMRNIEWTADNIFEDDEKILVKCIIRDYETNTALSEAIKIPKRTEKRQLKKGEKPLSQRVNSYGDTVFLLPATDDEVAQKRGALVSKTMRTLMLRMVPGDIMEECDSQIKKTRADEHARDPNAGIKRVVDAFIGLRITPAQLAEYLGHPCETMTASEVDDLRDIYQAIQDGDLAWVDVVEAKQVERDGEVAEGAVAKKIDHVQSTLEKAAAERKKGRDNGKQAPQAAAAPVPATPAQQPAKAPAKPAPEPDPENDGRE